MAPSCPAECPWCVSFILRQDRRQSEVFGGCDRYRLVRRRLPAETYGQPCMERLKERKIKSPQVPTPKHKETHRKDHPKAIASLPNEKIKKKWRHVDQPIATGFTMRRRLSQCTLKSGREPSEWIQCFALANASGFGYSSCYLFFQ